jgi:hypothetical protein
MNRKVTGILSYCTIVGWLVAFFAGDRAGAKFHLNQGFVYGILSLAASLLSGVFKMFSTWLVWPLLLAFGLLDVGITILSICGIVYAAQGRECALPLGNLFKVV